MKTKSFYLFALLSFSFFSCSESDTFSEKPVSQNTTRGVINKKYNSLGVSYDVTNNYLDIDATKYPVVDIEAFLADNPNSYIVNPTTQGGPYIYSGVDALDFISDIKTKNSIKDNATPYGSLSMTNEFNQKNTFSTKYAYGRGDVVKRISRMYLNATPSMLQKYLYPEFLRDLNLYTPEQFVKMYGTHVLLDITIGGSLQFNYRSTIEEASSTTEKKKTVESGLKFNIGSFGADRTNSHTNEEIKTWNKKNSTWKVWVTYSGGENSGTTVSYDSKDGSQSTSFNLSSWEGSVNANNAGIIEINWEKTYPIYEFITNVTKKEQIKKAVENYEKEKTLTMIKVKPLYRLFNDKARNTFCSSSLVEANLYINQIGYRWDYGDSRFPTSHILGYVYEDALSGTKPLYRLYIDKAQNSFCSSSLGEANLYISKIGYRWDEGDSRYLTGHTLGNILNTEAANSVPLYRLYNDKAQNSFWTSSLVEANLYINQIGYRWDYGDSRFPATQILGYILPRE